MSSSFRTASPAWALAGYAAIAGFRRAQTYGILVRTRGKASFDAHAVVVEPDSNTTYEAVRRLHGQWDVRTYRQCSERHLVRAARMGGDSLIEDTVRGAFEALADRQHPISLLVTLAAPDLAPAAVS